MRRGQSLGGWRDFVEVREQVDAELRRGAVRPRVVRRVDAGWARETLGDRAALLDHQASPLGPGVALPDDAAVARAYEERAAVPALDEDAPARAVERIARAAAACGATIEVHLRHQRQRVWIRDDARAVGDERSSVRLELSIGLPDGRPGTAVHRELAWDTPAGLAAAADDVDALITRARDDAARRQLAGPAPAGTLPIVFPAGSDAAVFFHEVCGHPLEADVVVRQASFLARARGRVIADSRVSVVDGPPADIGYRAAIDDEGAPVRTAKLIDGGRVADTLADAEHGAALGVASGHGRRVGWRHPPVARMTHTHMLGGAGSDTLASLLAPVARGLHVSHLTPRHMALGDGTFSFYVVEARMIEDGVLGAWVGPCILEGRGLDALAAIEAVGGDARGFYGIKGCGKLDHGPLDVSFGCPSLRFGALTVRPWSPAT